MNSTDFREWLKFMKLSDSEAARQLGVSRTTINKYKDSDPPLSIGLACAALTAELPPWTRPSTYDGRHRRAVDT